MESGHSRPDRTTTVIGLAATCAVVTNAPGGARRSLRTLDVERHRIRVRTRSSVRLAHNVYIDFPDSLWGRFCLWLFQSYLNGRQALYDHSFRELRFFKERLEGPASADVP